MVRVRLVNQMNLVDVKDVYQESEDEWQTRVMDYFRLMGWRVVHFHDSRREVRDKAGNRKMIGDQDAKSWPDLVVFRPRPNYLERTILFRELKTEKGRWRPGQQEMLADLRNAGQDADVRRPSQWDLVMQEAA